MNIEATTLGELRQKLNELAERRDVNAHIPWDVPFTTDGQDKGEAVLQIAEFNSNHASEGYILHVSVV